MGGEGSIHRGPGGNWGREEIGKDFSYLIELDAVFPIGHVVFDDLGAAFGSVLAADAFDEIAVGVCLRWGWCVSCCLYFFLGGGAGFLVLLVRCGFGLRGGVRWEGKI